MVLWALVLLAMLATVFGSNARTEVNLAYNLLENAQAEALADAGVYRAVAGLGKEPEEGGFRGDGRIYIWNTSDGEVRFSIRDEGGKIDLNQASPILLRELFIILGVDPRLSMDLADAIVDFRDEDTQKQPNGAEEREYASAGLTYGPKNEPFVLVDELFYVLGMTPDLYRRVAPLLTVRGQEETPHVYTAPPEVRMAMLAAQTATRSSSGRGAGAPGRSASERGFAVGDSTVGGAFGGSRAGAGNFGVSRSSESTLRGRGESVGETAFGDQGFDADADLTLRSRSGVPAFTVHAEGRIHTGAVFAREALVDFAGGENLPFVIRAWRRADRVLFPMEESRDIATP